MAKWIAREGSGRSHESEARLTMRTSDPLNHGFIQTAPKHVHRGRLVTGTRACLLHKHGHSHLPKPPHPQLLCLLKLKIFYKREHVMHLK